MMCACLIPSSPEGKPWSWTWEWRWTLCSLCDLQPMKLDNGTREEKAIRNTLLSTSISKGECAVPCQEGLVVWCVLPSCSEVDQVQGSQQMLQSAKGWGRAGETLTDLCWQMGIEGFISHAVVSCFAVCRDEMRKKSCLSIAAEGF